MRKLLRLHVYNYQFKLRSDKRLWYVLGNSSVLSNAKPAFMEPMSRSVVWSGIIFTEVHKSSIVASLLFTWDRRFPF